MESIQNLRILSQIFSPSMFEKIIRGQDTLSFIKKITGWQDKPQDCADDHHQAEIPALRFMAKMLPAQMNPDKPAQ